MAFTALPEEVLSQGADFLIVSDGCNLRICARLSGVVSELQELQIEFFVDYRGEELERVRGLWDHVHSETSESESDMDEDERDDMHGAVAGTSIAELPFEVLAHIGDFIVPDVVGSLAVYQINMVIDRPADMDPRDEQ